MNLCLILMAHTYAAFIAFRLNKLETKLEYIIQIKLSFFAVELKKACDFNTPPVLYVIEK